MENRSFRDAGGTPGGLGEFLIGLVMACIGGYLLANQVNVVGSYWSFYGTTLSELRCFRCCSGSAFSFGMDETFSAGCLLRADHFLSWQE